METEYKASWNQIPRVIQGGMAWVATHELASAVSNAGGLGIIGAGGARLHG